MTRAAQTSYGQMIVSEFSPKPTRAEPAFEAFYLSTGIQVSGELSASFRARELAREATAEALVRAFEYWDKVKRRDNPTGWVYCVGHNWGYVSPPSSAPHRARGCIAHGSRLPTRRCASAVDGRSPEARGRRMKAADLVDTMAMLRPRYLESVHTKRWPFPLPSASTLIGD